MKIIKVNNLSKSYKEVKAVDNISFDVEEGNLFAFLGVNGAGKSTTINILCTILAKDSGEVIINDHNLDGQEREIVQDIGIVFQNSVLDEALTVEENLKVRASLYQIFGKELEQKINYLNELFDFKSIMKRKVSKLSGGQKRKIDIVRALINNPKILFLDEPTTGLDPKTRITFWKIIEKLQREKKLTVFLTTHYMEEASNADQVVIIDEGKIIENDTPNNLKKKYTKNVIKLIEPKSDEVDSYLEENNIEYTYRSGHYEIILEDSDKVKKFIVKHKSIIHDFEVLKGDMDIVFLTVTGKRLN